VKWRAIFTQPYSGGGGDGAGTDSEGVTGSALYVHGGDITGRGG
jgi:hypothetical protein